MDWCNFVFKSRSGRYCQSNEGPRPRNVPIYYKHWLPDSPSNLLCQPVAPDSNTFLREYKEFDTIFHTTSFQNLPDILANGFKPRAVQDNSVVNSKYHLFHTSEHEISPRPTHPLSGTEILWYGPGKKSDVLEEDFTMERYGNMVFSMKKFDGYEGIYQQGLNYYFIEVIEYHTQSACRILVTPNEYPYLRKYNPYIIGGPWYCNGANGKSYSLKRIRRHEGNPSRNVLEIMKEPHSSESSFKNVWFGNHALTICRCISPRGGVRSFNYTCTDTDKMLQLYIGILGNILLPATHMFKLIPKFKSRKENSSYILRLLEDLHAESTTTDGQSEPEASSTSLERSVLDVLENQQSCFSNTVALLRNIRKITPVNFDEEMERDKTGYIHRLIIATAKCAMNFHYEDSLKLWYHNILNFIPDKYQQEFPKMLSDLIKNHYIFDYEYFEGT